MPQGCRPGGLRPAAYVAAARLGALVILTVLGLLTVAADSRADGAVVHCYDAARDMVSHVSADHCAGEIVDAEQAARLNARRAERVRRALERAAPPFTAGRRQTGVGTGFFVTRDGHLLTNAHVVATCPVISVEAAAGASAAAEILDLDRANDLALLATRLRPEAVAGFRQEARLASGRRVATIGYPSRGLPPLAPRLTGGMVLGLGDDDDTRTHLAIRADLRPGNSGGPLLDAHGQVAGVIVGKIDTAKVFRTTGQMVRGIGFAIKGPIVRQFLERNGVRYAVVGAVGPTLETAEILSRARPYVARVGCWR